MNAILIIGSILSFVVSIWVVSSMSKSSHPNQFEKIENAPAEFIIWAIVLIIGESLTILIYLLAKYLFSLQ